MQGIRSKGRKKAFQMLYQYEMTRLKPESLISQFWMLDGEKKEKIKFFANELFNLSLNNLNFSDVLIEKYLKDGWSLERLTEPVKNILRLGIAELFNGDAPVYAILDEYTTMAKEYEDEKAANLVNGILERIRKDFDIER